MDKNRINEILDMFPEQKPVVFNYAAARAAVLELLGALQDDKDSQEMAGALL